MDEENVVHLHNGVLLSGKTQWNTEIFREMDGTRRNHPELGDPVTKIKQYVLTHIWILEIEQRITSL